MDMSTTAHAGDCRSLNSGESRGGSLPDQVLIGYRGILLEHSVPFSSMAKKGELVQAFEENVRTKASVCPPLAVPSVGSYFVRRAY